MGGEAQVISEVSSWATLVQQLGSSTMLVAALIYVLVRHVIPAWERQGERREVTIQQTNTQLVGVMDRQREDMKEALEKLAASNDRVCGLVIALGERWGYDREGLIARAEAISGQRFEDGGR